MKHPPPMARKQSGIALVALLVLLILAGSYAFYRSSSIGAARLQQDAKLAATLARAKEALIAYAVTRNDDPGPPLKPGRPGSLPCPDLITNNAGFSNFPGDGKTDFFTVNSCPSYVGWLPWITLDLPELTDDTGTRLWYVLTPELRNHDSAHPINSDQVLTLKLDGVTDGIAALIIAARAPLGNQARPSNNPGDYLDGENGNGDDKTYISRPPSENFNDMVVAITRQELMAAVEKRVANEVKTCLEQHAAATANTGHTYPWPAPLSNSTFRGNAGSLFGQVPATQPGAGPENTLQQTTSALTNAKNALASASTATDQLAALAVVSEAANPARAFYDKLYGVAGALAQVAAGSRSAYVALDSHITSAIANGRISRTERTNLRAEAITVKDSLTALQTAIDDSGIDPFPGELLAQNLLLQQRINSATSSPTASNFTALQNQAALFVELFTRSTTHNPDISAALTTALGAAISTVGATTNAAASPTDAALATTASTAAQSLVTANNSLRSTITASRVNLHASEIGVRADQLSSLLAAVAAGDPWATTAAALASGLSDLQTTTSTLATTSSPVVVARKMLLGALTDALGAAQAASDFPLIEATTSTAITAARNLATAIANNGDNVLRESLAAAATDYIGAQEIFNAITPRTQAAMVPYVQAVQDPAADIAYWSAIIARIATDIASQARKVPTTPDIENSASTYHSADRLLSGISGTNGSQALLQAYVSAPTNSAKQAAATAALNTTLSQLDTLLTSAGTLDSLLDSGSAEAFPTLWYGDACAFLQPASGSRSWWTANNWTSTTFYQISDRVRPAVGKLSVNGSGSYRVVVLAAGARLPALNQNPSLREAKSFLEAANIGYDATKPIGQQYTRDVNDATAPNTKFASDTPSATFNDRLGY